jgi:bidirectional [NiFe] hydrogenase diaphorase subunit
MDSSTRAAPAPGAGHPSGDHRFAALAVTMKRHQFRHDALIEVLHEAQELFGYLDHDVLYFVAHHLKLPPSKVYGVATFYHFFSLKPPGKHRCLVCMGTACYVNGADGVLSAVEKLSGIRPGETTPNGELSLLTARCLGTCGLAPLIILDGEVRGHATPDRLVAALKGWLAHGPG